MECSEKGRLGAAFSKAFALVFEKGTGVIEKTYKKQQLEQEYQIRAFTAELKKDRKSLKDFSKKADASGTKNLLLSGLEGIGLGVLGVGLPDILLLIRCALAREQTWERAEVRMENFLKEEKLPEFYNRELEIQKTAEVLSQELLYMKFLQGLPVVGALGGAYDAVYLKAVLQYGKIIYKKRFLLKHKGEYHGESGERKEDAKGASVKADCQNPNGFSN